MDADEYIRDFIDPTLNEFRENPDDKRRGFLCMIVLWHFCDWAKVYFQESDINNVRKDITRYYGKFYLVGDVANFFKHVDLKRKKFKDADVKLDNIEIGQQAAFDDGTYFSDGTSWSDAQNVLRIKDLHGNPIDLLNVAEKAREAIGQYLRTRRQQPSSQITDS